jgi:hypothetical protein
LINFLNERLWHFDLPQTIKSGIETSMEDTKRRLKEVAADCNYAVSQSMKNNQGCFELMAFPEGRTTLPDKIGGGDPHT